MEIKEECKYTKEHEWAVNAGAGVRVGITDYAQIELGDVVFVELPEIGDEVTAGDSFGSVESVKAVSDIYAPVSGTVKAINKELDDSPQLVNESPFEQGWIIEIDPSDDSELDALLDAGAYSGYLKEIS